MWQTSKNREAKETWHTLPQSSLRLKGFAQARGFSRLDELLSPRREFEKWSSGVLTFSRLG